MEHSFQIEDRAKGAAVLQGAVGGIKIQMDDQHVWLEAWENGWYRHKLYSGIKIPCGAVVEGSGVILLLRRPVEIDGWMHLRIIVCAPIRMIALVAHEAEYRIERALADHLPGWQRLTVYDSVDGSVMGHWAVTNEQAAAVHRLRRQMDAAHSRRGGGPSCRPN